MSRHGDDFNEAAEGDTCATAQNACDVLTAFATKGPRRTNMLFL